MITKAELSRQRAEQETIKAQQAELDAQEVQQEAANRWAADMDHVETLLGAELSEILEAANADGHTAIRLGLNHVWRLTVTGRRPVWVRHSEPQSPLQFNPKENYPPTKRLVEILEQAGFHVRFTTAQLPASTHISWRIQIGWGD